MDLDKNGHLLHTDGRTTVPDADIAQHLERHLRLREDTTDIFVFVHGWRTKADDALTHARTLFSHVETLAAAQPHAYARLRGFRPQYVAVRWPSRDTRLLPTDYDPVKRRTQTMAADGHVPRVLGAILGYLNAHRDTPEPGPETLTTAYGQYLHCTGHSFGSRVLLHGILEATERLTDGGPDTLAWDFAHTTYPWTLDSLTLFQPALPADAFTHEPFSKILNPNLLNAPITMTYSPSDTALGKLHSKKENQVAVGYRGASAPPDHIAQITLLDTTTPYTFPRYKRLINVDASKLYTVNKLFVGAHSDFYHPESAHLLLSLADSAR
ncbi:hypothetical protein [Streptomyces sp. WAC04114]|uniref:hypothetical protein n=1 Tax=Streptomyces sp. WAC04114 TaxID=2867961 RepID=UPI001C8C45A9|nr:hypothetical protein [Streptomyces sp. WAC04114]MBX9365570.1 hypothetical protein [Streptomyces sp. WAC04114]